MKVALELFAMSIPSIESLGLAAESQLLKLWSQLRGLTTTAGLAFFGRTDELKPIQSTKQLAGEFRKKNVGLFSFADVKNLAGATQPRLHWRVGITRALVTAIGERESVVEEMHTMVNELVALNRIVLSSISGASVAVPFSFLRIPSLSFKRTRPPRFLGRLRTDSIVDLVYPNAVYSREEQLIINQLKANDSVVPARRTLQDDILVVEWGDITRQPAETILTQRYAWYVERGNFPIDSSYNSIGDEEFALWQGKPTRQLTSYSEFNRKATKALVFDRPENVVEVLEELQGILASGKTIEGYPVDDITLILPSRESAIEIRPLANQYAMSVVYVGEDNRLWNPFPPEYEHA
jgi:hypothetical protein